MHTNLSLMARLRIAATTISAVALLSGGPLACSLSDLVNAAALPADQRDQSAVRTPEGALAAYRSAVAGLSMAVGGRQFNDSSPALSSGATSSYIFVTGMFTDELQFLRDFMGSGAFPLSGEASVDSRIVPDNDYSATGKQRAVYWKNTYDALHTVRNRSRQATAALRTYAPAAPAALVGDAMAMEAITEVLLAELFCSGIPLSTMGFEGGFTLTRGYSSDEVYQHAITLFDSALVQAADSARIVNFAKVGRARAQLALGQYAAAAQTVEGIPTEYVYLLKYVPTRMNAFAVSATVTLTFAATIGNTDGRNGLPFRFGGDPRSASVRKIEGVDTLYIPARYIPVGAPPNSNPGTAPIPLASGIEARLIEAEAAFQAGETARMLQILNKLRTTCTTTVGCPTPAPAGDGGYANLPPLSDPGSDTARVSLLFTERAHWLFLTGHRQGDLRRMIRQYDRRQENLYPIGPWGVQAVTTYGFDVTLPVPVEEQDANGLYRGCVNRDA